MAAQSNTIRTRTHSTVFKHTGKIVYCSLRLVQDEPHGNSTVVSWSLHIAVQRQHRVHRMCGQRRASLLSRTLTAVLNTRSESVVVLCGHFATIVNSHSWITPCPFPIPAGETGIRSSRCTPLSLVSSTYKPKFSDVDLSNDYFKSVLAYSIHIR